MPNFKLKKSKSPSHSAQAEQPSHQGERLRWLLNSESRRRLWLGLGACLGIGGAIATGLVWYRLERNLPQSVESALTFAREGTLTIQSANGTVLQEIGPVTHQKLKIWQMPEPVIEAFVASEDRRFYNHHGVDYQGIVRAALVNLRAGEVVEGGSTITQQLARIAFLSQERSLWRKLKETLLAQRIEQKLSKEQILERYLNLVYLGSGAYGVADAASVYFNKSVDELSLAQAATLAGITPAPSVYSPFTNQKAALERRNLVLKRMQQQGMITASEAATALASPLITQRSQPQRFQQTSFFTDYVQRELPKLVLPEFLEAGGIIVETTLNPEWQEAAEATVKDAIARYGKWQRFEQAALVAIDPRNGQIRAMVGGEDFDDNQYNRVTQAQRQPGSTFKPFVYATAIATGMSPYKTFLDAPYIIDGYEPKNYGSRYRGGYVSLYNALAASLNVVAVRTLVDIGWNPIIKLAHKIGIESKLQPTYSLALGAFEVNLLELTSAYGTLANRGVYQRPYGVSRILDRDGKVLYQANFEPQVALDEDSAAIITWMLQEVVTSGTGRPAQIGRPVAGKTGTSDKARDLWFVGYIPQAVTGIWLGNDDNQPTSGTSGTAAELWRQFMLEAVKELPVESFPERPSLDGRKGTIKAEPIKPKRSYYTQKPYSAPTTRIGRSSRRRRNSYRRPSYQPPAQTRTYRPAPKQTAPAPAPTPPSSSVPIPVPAPAPAPAPSINKPSKPSVSPPALDIPIAPPASRKE